MLVCGLSPQLHMLFPPGWRLGLSAKGGGGMGGKGEGREVDRATTYPQAEELVKGGGLQGPEKPKGNTEEGVGDWM